MDQSKRDVEKRQKKVNYDDGDGVDHGGVGVDGMGYVFDDLPIARHRDGDGVPESYRSLLIR